MIRACIIGVSGFGEKHYTDLMREVDSGRMQAVAATVINQNEEQEKCTALRSLGAELFTDYREMLDRYNGQADLCFIPTGIPLHAPMSIAAVNAGMNVYVEKPVAATIQDVRAMQEAERAADRFIAVGFQHSYVDTTLDLKKRLLDGDFGELKSIAIRVLWPRPTGYYARNGWAGRMRLDDGTWVLDSPFNNATAHYVNLACFWAGTAFNVSAELSTVTAELHRANRIQSPDTAAIRAVTRTGIPILYLGTHASTDSRGPHIRIATEKAVIVWSGPDETMEIAWSDGRHESLHAFSDTGASLRGSVMDRLNARFTDPDAFICSLDIAGAQTLYTNGAHESSDVNELPGRYVGISTVPQGKQFAIHGISELFETCYADELLFSEAGAEWAVPGETFDMTGYAEFTGGRWSG